MPLFMFYTSFIVSMSENTAHKTTTYKEWKEKISAQNADFI